MTQTEKVEALLLAMRETLGKAWTVTPRLIGDSGEVGFEIRSAGVVTLGVGAEAWGQADTDPAKFLEQRLAEIRAAKEWLREAIAEESEDIGSGKETGRDEKYCQACGIDYAIEWADLITPSGFARVCSFCRTREGATSENLVARIEARKQGHG